MNKNVISLGIKYLILMTMSKNPMHLQKVSKKNFKLPERQKIFPGLPFQLGSWSKGSLNLSKLSREAILGISLPYLKLTCKNA